MNLIEIIFELIRRFLPYDEQEFAEKKAQAKRWWSELRSDDSVDNKTPVIGRKVKAFFGEWYGWVAGAVIYFVAIKWIRDFMSEPTDQPDKNDK